MQRTQPLSKNTNNDIARRCANIPVINERIKQIAKSWTKKSKINKLDITEYLKTALARQNIPLVYINN